MVKTRIEPPYDNLTIQEEITVSSGFVNELVRCNLDSACSLSLVFF